MRWVNVLVNSKIKYFVSSNRCSSQGEGNGAIMEGLQLLHLSRSRYSGTLLTDTLNGGQPLYNGQVIKSQMQRPIHVCINAPSIVDTSLFHKPDTAQFPDTASTTVQHLANHGHK